MCQNEETAALIKVEKPKQQIRIEYSKANAPSIPHAIDYLLQV
jgi:hypothetical protein